VGRNQWCLPQWNESWGSSGGEGALLAMRGSPLASEQDIGGSIRIPSAFNYLYGLKPTFGRFPTYGAKSGITGQDFIYSNNGPMSRSLEALKLYCEAVLSTEVSPWTLDPKCVPIPWRREVIAPKGRKLRFGIISDNDGEIKCASSHCSWTCNDKESARSSRA